VTITVPLLGALDRIWATIRDRHPDVPDVIFTIQPGTAVERSVGHLATARWRTGILSELAIAGDALAGDVEDTLAVLLHMAAHGLAHTRGIADTSRQGRYHNSRYAALADELGLRTEPTHNDMGVAHTQVPPLTTARYAGPLGDLRVALTEDVRAMVADVGQASRAASTRRTSSNNPLSTICSCRPKPRRIRVAASVLGEGPIICGICRQEFTPAGE
jgi:hypothetical protein